MLSQLTKVTHPPFDQATCGLGSLASDYATLRGKGWSSRRSGRIRPHLVATRHWLHASWNLSFRSMLSFQQRNRPDWQLLEKPLGVMPGRLFLLTREGDMPNDKPLKPDDFPVEVEGDELMTADGKPIGKAETPAIAEDVAERLNEDDSRKEQDRWSA